jgi:hypothetical protein
MSADKTLGIKLMKMMKRVLKGQSLLSMGDPNGTEIRVVWDAEGIFWSAAA